MQPAPVDDRIVVSEIGEQWSPNTLPDRVAARDTTISSGATASATGTTMGIRIPKVPQAVPVEKLRNAAMAKIKAGRRAPGMVLPATTSFTKSAVSSRSRPLIVQASIRMAQAGSMDFMPS